jgi:hypothetical protein
MTEQFTFSEDKARAIGETIGIDWATSRFGRSLDVESPVSPDGEPRQRDCRGGDGWGAAG